jgi:uncharacterized SAM-binding protein YcdF (DUF218 family)
LSFRRSALYISAGLIVGAILLFLTRGAWLPAIGYSLVRSDQPGPADAILVLGGDFHGNRILKGCELAKAGYAPVVLVSGALVWYGINEADAAIDLAKRHGCPADRFEPVIVKALSTVEEARAFKPVFERRKIRSILLVTSNFHTRRAGRTFEKELDGAATVRLVPAADLYFDPASWWRERQGQKTVFYEVSKTVANWFGL